jgi:hypothetical protein
LQFNISFDPASPDLGSLTASGFIPADIAWGNLAISITSPVAPL